MKVQRRGFLGGLVTLPFVAKATVAEVIAPKPMDVQAAKKAWRNYIGKLEKVAEGALWQGKDLQQAMAEVEEYKRLNPPPPHANQKDRIAVMTNLWRLDGF